MNETQASPQKIDQMVCQEVGNEHRLNFREFYPVNESFGYVGISIERETGKLSYLTIEPTMTDERETESRKVEDGARGSVVGQKTIAQEAP
jgi:hypothetical protein